MAGDWIKVQKDTPDKPEVLAIASKLDIDPDAVVGKLIRIWSWFDTHTVDGNAQSVTFSFVDRLCGVTGFAQKVADVGWLERVDDNLRLPNFGYHNGETAKTRALGKNRAQKFRGNAGGNDERNDTSVTKPLPEKRREEKIPITNVIGKEPAAQDPTTKKPKTPAIDRPADVTEQTWADWLALRKAKKAPVTSTVVNAAQREAEKASMTLEAFLQIWCSRGSQGLQADWIKPQERQQFQQREHKHAAAARAIFDGVFEQ